MEPREILDYFGDTEGKQADLSDVVKLRRFESAIKANIYRARLESEDIKSAVYGDHMANILQTHFHEVTLLVHKRDAERVREIFEEMDRNEHAPLSQDFSDADEDEIAYQKALHEARNKPDHTYRWIIIAMVAFLVLMLIRRIGWVL